MIRILVNGAKGKMGSETVKAVMADSDLELVGQADQGDDLAALIGSSGADVVVDFTRPDHIFETIQTILRAGAYPVVGTTGLSDAQLSELDSLSRELDRAVLICPNFAIGAILMMMCAKKIAPYMPRVEISEYHHDRKADAPSGTAIKTADVIADAYPDINTVELDETELIEGARGGSKHRIPIHSIRLPGFVASQSVVFGDVGQTLTVRHDTISRESFMPGVILACKKAKECSGLMYGLETILDL